jgi:hypothetical protein
MNTLITKIALALAPLLAEQIAKQLAPLVPLVATAVGKAILDALKGSLPNLPDLGVEDLAKNAVKVVSDIDPDIPYLSDIFDLSDFVGKLVNK